MRLRLISDAPTDRRAEAWLAVCFSPLSFYETCEVCGRPHPAGPSEQCYERRAETEAESLDAELDAYLGSPEARFFSWLAARA